MKVLKTTYIFKTSAKFHKLVHFRAILSLVQKLDVIQQECYFDTLLATRTPDLCSVDSIYNINIFK